MKNTRKLIVGVIAAAGFAAATVAYADPPPGFGPGSSACDGTGPGAMGYGGRGGGYGPGMMAHGGPRGGYGPGMTGGWGPRGGSAPGAAAGPVARHEARLAFLKEELKITADQQAAWDAYATQLKARAATMEAFHAQAPSAGLTPAERIEQRAGFAKLRAEQMTAMSAAVKDLYAVLTPEQKAIADRHFGGVQVAQRGYGRGRW